MNQVLGLFKQPAPQTRRGFLYAGGCAAGGAALFAYLENYRFIDQYVSERSQPVAPAPHRPETSNWSCTGLHAAWLGHSTVLLQIDGFRILTDPVFSTYAGLHWGPLSMGIKRLVAPALAIGEVGPVDLILLSHAHMDHFDIPSLRLLANRRTAVIAAAQTADLLPAARYASVRELRWGESARVRDTRVSALPVKHFGARLRRDRYRRYNGYFIECGRYSVLFAGDTAFTGVFRGLKRTRAIDVAIMPVGAYDPWIRVHCTPEQAWQMANDAGADLLLPVHHQTFRLSREPVTEPLERLLEAAGSQAERVPVRAIGQELAVSRG